MRKARRNAVTVSLLALVVLVVLVGAGRGDSVSGLRMVVGRYEQDLLLWEMSHFLDKWAHLALRPIRGTPSAEERAAAIDEFFALGQELASHRTALSRALAIDPFAEGAEVATFQARVEALEKRRSELQPVVEEALEAAVSQALEEMGIIDRFGPIRWPPVDFTFESNSLVLVRSPRDEIRRLDDLLLRPDTSLLEQVALEAQVEEMDGTSALVVAVGGVATYPAQVTPYAGLRHTLFLIAHEWVHHWLFFRPLGRSWWAGGELTSINETVADIVAEEVGDRAYELLTGTKVQRPPWTPPTLQPPTEPEPGVFDYTREMRRTRVRLEELLAEGKVEEAEAYLEERRKEFVAHGYAIRKLNTAWFAFFGTYATSAGSISPIEAQLRTIRAESGDLRAFLDRVAGITRPGMLETMALEAGWTPVPVEGDRA